LDKFSEVAIIH